MLDAFLRLIGREPCRLAVVRKYMDANGAYVGELYVWAKIARKYDTLEGYVMIGATLDTLPFDTTAWDSGRLDTVNSFLEPMQRNRLRVGGLVPEDDAMVRKTVRAMAFMRPLEVGIQNRFIEYAMQKGNA